MSTPELVLQTRDLRQQLHGCAEISFEETRTSAAVAEWLTMRGVPVQREVAGTGLVVQLESAHPGPTRLFRADLDAIGTAEGRHEVNLGPRHAHGSERAAEHACGHDGHTAMLAGALAALAASPEAWQGRVVGVFQPAEEIGEGAQAMLMHDALRDRSVEEAYALHNQPGLPLGEIAVSTGVAALASTGVVARMEGQGTHASTPHKGNAAISAMSTFVRELLALPSHVVPFGNSVLITPTYLDAGKRQFGRVPPQAELGAVVRADSGTCLDVVMQAAEARLVMLAEAYGLRAHLERVEPFPVTVNDWEVVHRAQASFEQAGFVVRMRDHAQPWSEDFGYFLARWPGALLLLGAGDDHPSLHSPEYAFPDELVGHGIDLWLTLAGWQGPAHRSRP